MNSAKQRYRRLFPLMCAFAIRLWFFAALASAAPIPELRPQSYGAVCDGVTNDGPAFQKLAAAVNAAGGGVIILPVGTCYLGSTIDEQPNTFGIINITTGNVVIRGAGAGRSILTYTSVGIEGTAIWVSKYHSSAAELNGFTAEDFTLHDLSTTGRHGAGVSGITVYVVSNVLIQRLECIDIKGNAAITADGEFDHQISNVRILDNTIRGTATGKWIDGDGINVGRADNVSILRNSITDVGRLSIEGGADTSNARVASNNIFDNRGSFGGMIGNFGGNIVQITDNYIYTAISASDRYAISIVKEGTVNKPTNVVVSRNTIDAVNARGIFIPIDTDGLEISHNTVHADIPIEGGGGVFGIWNISDNTLYGAHRDLLVAFWNCTYDPNASLTMTGNTFITTAAPDPARPLDVIDFKVWPNANSPHTHIDHNTLRSTSAAITDQTKKK